MKPYADEIYWTPERIATEIFWRAGCWIDGRRLGGAYTGRGWYGDNPADGFNPYLEGWTDSRPCPTIWAMYSGHKQVGSHRPDEAPKDAGHYFVTQRYPDGRSAFYEYCKTWEQARELWYKARLADYELGFKHILELRADTRKEARREYWSGLLATLFRPSIFRDEGLSRFTLGIWARTLVSLLFGCKTPRTHRYQYNITVASWPIGGVFKKWCKYGDRSWYQIDGRETGFGYEIFTDSCD